MTHTHLMSKYFFPLALSDNIEAKQSQVVPLVMCVSVQGKQTACTHSCPHTVQL